MFNLSQEDLDTLKAYSVRPSCTKCSNLATWIDYGHAVGAGYYCRICKDDVEHDDNVYGTIARQRRKPKEVKKQVSYSIINCPKTNCKHCISGPKFIGDHVAFFSVKVGNKVKCVSNNGTPKLIEGQLYEIVALEPESIRIKVGVEDLAYVVCRFHLEVEHA